MRGILHSPRNCHKIIWSLMSFAITGTAVSWYSMMLVVKGQKLSSVYQTGCLITSVICHMWCKFADRMAFDPGIIPLAGLFLYSSCDIRTHHPRHSTDAVRMPILSKKTRHFEIEMPDPLCGRTAPEPQKQTDLPGALIRTRIFIRRSVPFSLLREHRGYAYPRVLLCSCV